MNGERLWYLLYYIGAGIIIIVAVAAVVIFLWLQQVTAFIA